MTSRIIHFLLEKGFISKEDLIQNKKASGRKKDLDDLNELES